MYCIKCGQMLPDDACFCLKCRTRTINNTVFENKPVKMNEKTDKEDEEQKLAALKEKQAQLNRDAYMQQKEAIDDARDSRTNAMVICGLILFVAFCAAVIFGIRLEDNLTAETLSGFMISCAVALGVFFGMIRLYLIRG